MNKKKFIEGLKKRRKELQEALAKSVK